jgi:diguanylate cyclase
LSLAAPKPLIAQARRLRGLPAAFSAMAVASTFLLGLSINSIRQNPQDYIEYSVLAAGILIWAFACYNTLRIRSVIKAVEEAERSAFQLAGHDPLSGLPNRRVFTERLDTELGRMKRSGTGLAVFFLDLDKFKDVNDTFGHAGGDSLIVQFAGRLADLLRGADTLARLGGDEFAIVQTEVRSLQDVEALARRILAATHEPFLLSGGSAFVGVSIGIALAPDHADKAEALMKLADAALYEAKSGGRNRYDVFARQLGDQMKLRQLVEADLRLAIENDHLSLAYQPLVRADDEAIEGFEALVRWIHPTMGPISPAEFVPMAESSGLINTLGEWVLRRACIDALAWPEHCFVSVNVSPIQFKHKDFVSEVSRILAETGISPQRVVLELTEGVVVEDADVAEAAIMDLRALGVRFALDDFGTGYSSLIYLRRFAFDKIKIDRSFLDSLESTGESAILLHSVVHLGRALGLTVVAEGVETVEQHRLLQAVGCHLLQGFHFGRPVAQAETLALLAASEGAKEAA